MRTWLVVIALVMFRDVAAEPTPPLTPDVPPKYVEAKPGADFERREVMIPMRDGVKLHTVLMIPKGATKAPIMLTRTPYNASKRTDRTTSTSMSVSLGVGDDVIAADPRYIRAYQDVRGKYGSEGDYVMTRPLRGPLNDSKVDHSTDAYDTIDWLVKNIPETNGKVGMIGSSYEGFTVLMALVHPHPALRVAVPMSPMVDGWKGDDWFHNGAFRQTNFDYFAHQTAEKGEGKHISRSDYDDYEAFRRAGSAGDFAKLYGLDQLPYWKKISEHPAYDAYWQGQALDQILGKQPPPVPTMVVCSLWDQEDMYGGIATYTALERSDTANDRVFLALGPWRHSGVNGDGSTLGPLKFDGDTAWQFRKDVMKPFLDHYLLGTPATTPPVFVFETGTDTWKKLAKFPPATKTRPLYVQVGGHAGFDAPKSTSFDEYVADPAKPVPYIPRPVRFEDSDTWRRWLVMDQRAVADRPDVLVYTTEPLTAPVAISGAPIANLFASTTGTDADWVVKLIDVYPDQVAAQPEMGGYQLAIAMDIFRGRYRDSLEHPSPIPANQVVHYRFALPAVNHVFLPRHRIMVQIQSSWFPLYDRNPQTYVDNIFFAKPADYKKATQRIYHQPGGASAIELPVR